MTKIKKNLVSGDARKDWFTKVYNRIIAFIHTLNRCNVRYTSLRTVTLKEFCTYGESTYNCSLDLLFRGHHHHLLSPDRQCHLCHKVSIKRWYTVNCHIIGFQCVFGCHNSQNVLPLFFVILQQLLPTFFTLWWDLHYYDFFNWGVNVVWL